jgi:hypothetical protein
VPNIEAYQRIKIGVHPNLQPLTFFYNFVLVLIRFN